MNQNLLLLGRQLVAIWKELGLNQRISIIVTGLAVAAGLTGLVLWSSRADFSLLYGSLDETEAARVTEALDEANTPYRIGSGGRAILVPSDKVHQIRMQLAAKGIPRGEGVGFEIFDKPNFGISDFVQRANYTRAVQGELGRTISQLDQVESARVMIVLPENRLLTDSKRKPTASVFVRVKGNAQLPAASIQSIRFLVANAVEGLSANHVTVVDNLGNVLSENQEPDSIAALSGNQLTARLQYEQYLARKAESMLEKVLGPGHAVVRVSAEINSDSIQRTEEQYDPESVVLRTATITDESVDSVTASSGGAPGLAANAAAGAEATNSNAAAESPVTSSRTKKKQTSNNWEINRVTSTVSQSAGGIKRLTAAVFVAQRFEGTGAARKAAPRSPEELQKLRRIVQTALGIQESEGERRDEITLEEIPFNDQPATELTQQLDQQQQRQFWVELAQKLLYPALALGVLMAFWRTLKKSKSEDMPLNLPIETFAHSKPGANGHGNGHASAPGAGLAAPNPGNRVTAELLNQLIRENPANMTQAVRTWLTQRNTSN